MIRAICLLLVIGNGFAQSHGSAGSAAVSGRMGGAPLHSVTLTWVGSTGAMSYSVYRSTSTGTETKLADAGNNLNFTDQNVVAGQTYYYTVTAIGPGGVESSFSNEASATVPSP